MDQAITTTKAFRISEELKTRIEKAQADQGAVEFWEMILSALDAREGQVEKPTTKEAETVRRALAQVEQVVLAALRLADEARVQSGVEVETIRAQTSEWEREAREEKKVLETELAAAKEEYRKVSEEVTRLAAQAENVAELKTLWKEREVGLLERIAALDAEASEIRKLKEDFSEVRAELVAAQTKAKDLEHALALQDKDLSAAQAETGVSREALGNVKADLETERQTCAAIRADLDAERKTHAQNRAELAAAKAQVEGLREASDTLREAHQKDRQALEEDRAALGKAQVDLATAIAQAQAAREALERERKNGGNFDNPDTPTKAPAASGSRAPKSKP